MGSVSGSKTCPFWGLSHRLTLTLKLQSPSHTKDSANAIPNNGRRFAPETREPCLHPEKRFSEMERCKPTERTILVVDDEDCIREIVGFMLRRAGFRVVQASSATEALALLDSG